MAPLSALRPCAVTSRVGTASDPRTRIGLGRTSPAVCRLWLRVQIGGICRDRSRSLTQSGCSVAFPKRIGSHLGPEAWYGLRAQTGLSVEPHPLSSDCSLLSLIFFRVFWRLGPWRLDQEESMTGDDGLTLVPLPSRRRHVTNFSWLMVEQAVRVAGAVLIGAYVARYLGPERYGLLAYAMSYVALFVAISAVGIEPIAVRRLIRKSDEEPRILGTALVLRLMGTLAMWLLISLSLLVSRIDSEPRVLISILALGTGFQVFRVIEFHYLSRVESRYVVRIQLVVLGLSAVLKVVLVQLAAPLVWFALVVAFDGLVLSAGLVLVYRFRSRRVLRWRFDPALARQLLRDSWPILVYAYFVAANMNLDRIMLGALMDDRSVGLYSAAVSVSSVWYFIPLAFGSTFFPYIVSKSEQEDDGNIATLFSLLQILSVFGAVVVAALSSNIVDMMFGSEFQDASSVLAIHIFTGIFLFHVSLRSRVLTARNQQRLSTWLMGGCLATNAVGNALLIPAFGIVGAAWASVLSWAACVLVFPLLAEETRSFVRVFFSPTVIGLGKLRR